MQFIIVIYLENYFHDYVTENKPNQMRERWIENQSIWKVWCCFTTYLKFLPNFSQGSLRVKKEIR